MTRKQRRLWLVGLCLLGLGTAVGLSLAALRQDVVFFVTPTSLAGKDGDQAKAGRTVRLGGLVEAGSVKRTNVNGDSMAQFIITDGAKTVPVIYRGILPDLFREGQGVVTLGSLDSKGQFQASEVLAKHDENYMPKDLEDALKKEGHWNPATGAPPPPPSAWKKMLVESKSSS
jgi:cytochrome c-type biogenesis protein CcmE